MTEGIQCYDGDGVDRPYHTISCGAFQMEKEMTSTVSPSTITDGVMWFYTEEERLAFESKWRGISKYMFPELIIYMNNPPRPEWAHPSSMTFLNAILTTFDFNYSPLMEPYPHALRVSIIHQPYAPFVSG